MSNLYYFLKKIVLLATVKLQDCQGTILTCTYRTGLRQQVRFMYNIALNGVIA